MNFWLKLTYLKPHEKQPKSSAMCTPAECFNLLFITRYNKFHHKSEREIMFRLLVINTGCEFICVPASCSVFLFPSNLFALQNSFKIALNTNFDF